VPGKNINKYPESNKLMEKIFFDNLKNKLVKSGASLVGFATLDDFYNPYYPEMSGGISIAVALDPDIIREIKISPTVKYNQEYFRVNNVLRNLGKIAVEFLNNIGYKSIALAPTEPAENIKNLTTRLPHKTIATRSGLGWIGKTALLVTKEYGSAIRLTTVLTDAVFGKLNNKIDKSQCGNCKICVDLCPAKAASGAEWNINLVREDFFDADVCYKTVLEIAQKAGINNTICGKCIAVCPWTIKYLNKRK